MPGNGEQRRVINFITAAGHQYTLRHLIPALKVPARCWTYEQVIRRAHLPGGTWIFTDHERLSPFELSIAGSIAEDLRRAGCRVLNHPARWRSRVGLLSALSDQGINRFRAYRAEEAPMPSRFPVFIRREFDHRGSSSGLIETQAELDAALAKLQGEGMPLIGQLVIEYSAEEAAPGIWYRGSAYRAGDTIISHHMGIDSHWMVKDGFDAARLEAYEGREAFLAAEKAFVIDNQHSGLLARAFDIAGIEYGRADFGFVGGTIQIYEINTNPNQARHTELFGTMHPGRVPTQRLAEQRLHDAICATDTEAAGRVALTGRALKRQRSLLPIRIRAWRRP